MDALGRRVIENRVEVGRGISKAEVDLSSFVSRNCHYTVRNDSGIIANVTLIKI